MFIPVLLLTSFAAAAPEKLEVGFEDGKVPEVFVVKAPKDYSIQVQSEVVRKGKFAARFEIRKGDAFQDGSAHEGFRSELKDRYRATRGGEDWYSISFYLPKDFPIHGNRLVIGQWNAEPDDEAEEALGRSPPLSQRFINGEFRVQLYKEPITVKLPLAGRKILFRTKKLELGKWHDFVYHVRWSHKKDGFVKAWMNGKPIVDYNGPVGYDDKRGPYFKFGLYRDDVPETYVAYFDEYRRGKARKDVE